MIDGLMMMMMMMEAGWLLKGFCEVLCCVEGCTSTAHCDLLALLCT